MKMGKILKLKGDGGVRRQWVRGSGRIEAKKRERFYEGPAVGLKVSADCSE